MQPSLPLSGYRPQQGEHSFTPCAKCSHLNNPWDKHCSLCRVNLQSQCVEKVSPTVFQPRIPRKSGFPRSTFIGIPGNTITKKQFTTVFTANKRVEKRLAEIDALLD
jgi:hypothetical protein